MYDEEYFIAKLNTGETFTQEELEAMILYHDVDDGTVDSLDDHLWFIPVRLCDQIYLILCNCKHHDIFLHQPIKAEKSWRDTWTPVDDVDDLFGQWSSELTNQPVHEEVVQEPEDLLSVNAELIEYIKEQHKRLKEMFGNMNDATWEEREAASKYIDTLEEVE